MLDLVHTAKEARAFAKSPPDLGTEFQDAVVIDTAPTFKTKSRGNRLPLSSQLSEVSFIGKSVAYDILCMAFAFYSRRGPSEDIIVLGSAVMVPSGPIRRLRGGLSEGGRPGAQLEPVLERVTFLVEFETHLADFLLEKRGDKGSYPALNCPFSRIRHGRRVGAAFLQELFGACLYLVKGDNLAPSFFRGCGCGSAVAVLSLDSAARNNH